MEGVQATNNFSSEGLLPRKWRNAEKMVHQRWWWEGGGVGAGKCSEDLKVGTTVYLTPSPKAQISRCQICYAREHFSPK